MTSLKRPYGERIAAALFPAHQPAVVQALVKDLPRVGPLFRFERLGIDQDHARVRLVIDTGLSSDGLESVTTGHCGNFAHAKDASTARIVLDTTARDWRIARENERLPVVR